MRLFGETIDREVGELHENGVQIRVLGDRARLSESLQQKVAQAEALTAGDTAAILNVAINYGGRREIVDAIRELAGSGCDLSVARRAGDQRRAVHPRPARPGPDRAHRRRAPHQQLPALAGRVRRAVRHRHAVARLRRSGDPRRALRLLQSRAEVRRASPSRTSASPPTRAPRSTPRGRNEPRSPGASPGWCSWR